ncbi:MAG: hypothetical protein SFX73_08265 [Kofleriaceae bacterium]|nr:hypothetical protein [Kofleriaceae bacterium]
MHRYLALPFLATAACTTLGPTPASTLVSAVPTDRTGVEVQAARVPAFFLSDAADKTPDELPSTPQLSALLEPDKWFGTKGLILGARAFGESGDSPFEPMLGYRRKLDERFSLAGVVFGTHARGAQNGASYEATRFGGELVLDGTLVPIGSWLALHVHASVNATYLDATGTYCVLADGDATDCGETTRRVDGAVAGIYSAATAGITLDIARRPQGAIHSVRIGLVSSVGGMPKLRDGIQEPNNEHFTSFGAYVALGFGSAK